MAGYIILFVSFITRTRILPKWISLSMLLLNVISITLQQLKGLAATDPFNCFERSSIPFIPGSGKDFYVCIFVLSLCSFFFGPKTIFVIQICNFLGNLIFFSMRNIQWTRQFRIIDRIRYLFFPNDTVFRYFNYPVIFHNLLAAWNLLLAVETWLTEVVIWKRLTAPLSGELKVPQN